MKKLLLMATVVLTAAFALQAAYSWNSVQIWGGGYVPGVEFHPTEEGLVYIRTDVGGSYRLNPDRQSWLPLNDMFTSGSDMGSVAVGLDADNPNMVYVTGGLYLALDWGGPATFFRSENRGAAWTRVVLNTTTVSGTASNRVDSDGNLRLGGNAGNRGTGNRIAASGTTVYLGTDQNGLLRSTDRGDTWTTVTAAGISNTSGVSAVLFDKDGNVYAAPFAGGIYKSANGTAWSRVGSFTGAVYQMSYDPAGNEIWFTTNTGRPQDQSEISGGSVYKLNLSSDTFIEITMPEKGGKDYGYIGISVNPNSPQQVLVSTGGWWKGTGSNPLDGADFVPHEAIFLSLDGGQNWKDILLNATYNTATAYNAVTNNPHWISALAVNPHDQDHVIFGTGYGVWSTFNATAEKPEWVFTNRGIEETVPLGLASTRYGAPLVSVLGDIDGFYHADLNTPPPARHKMEDGVNETGTNYDIDFAGQRPNYMVRIHKNIPMHLGAYSEDGGKTWRNFRSSPPSTTNPHWPDPNTSGENNFVAVSADGSAIVFNMDTHGVYYSTNNGTTWTASSTPANLLQGFKPVADRVTPGTFYINNARNGTFYRSTDNGATWTAVSTNLAMAGGDWAYWAFRSFSSPDRAGEVWIAQGAKIYPCTPADASWCSWAQYFPNEGMWLNEGDAEGGLMRSTNGGTSFTRINGILFARSIGFGRGRNAGDPSAVYVAGMISSGMQGVFRSDNSGSTWTRVNDDNHAYGEITMVTGDPCVYSRVYLATSGRGIVQGVDPAFDQVCNTCVDRIENGGPVSVRNRMPVSSIKKPTLVRHGKILRSNAPIQLYSITGRLIAVSSSKAPDAATLNLSRIPSGVYIAKSGAATLRVQVQK